MGENYERFMQRCEIFFPHSVCVRIGVAYALAKHFHRFDVRQSEQGPDAQPLRYFEHPRRVALYTIDSMQIPDAEIVMCALLHDSVEDTRLSPEAITLVCGEEVSKRVMLLTKRPKEGYMARLVAHGDWKTLVVKCADRLDNLRTIGSNVEFVVKQVDETKKHYLALADVMVSRAPDEQRERVMYLQHELRGVVDRLESQLDKALR